MDLTPIGMALLAGATALHSVPHIVQAWRSRSLTHDSLVLKALGDVERLTMEAKERDERMEKLEAELEDVRLARSHADGQIAIFQLQLDRALTEQELWEGRARALAEQLDDLYRAVSSSEQGKSLPPCPQRNW
jgi:chromosome segregation ATPase